MNQTKTKRPAKSFPPKSWMRDGPTHLAGFLVFLISLLHLPASIPALNSFDPLKRMGWAGVALGVFLWVLFLKRERLDRVPVSILVLLFWMVFRTWLRPVPFRELEVLASWIQPFLLFLAGRVWFSESRPLNTKVLGNWLLFTGFLQAGVMVAQYLGQDPFFVSTTSSFDYKPARMIGTIGYQNQAVDFLCVALAGLWLRFPSQFPRILWLGFCGGVIVLTANRGGFFAFFIGVIVCTIGATFKAFAFPLKKEWRKFLPLCGVFGLFVLGLFFLPEFRERFASLVFKIDQNVAVQSRLWMHRVAVDLWKENPLLGAGAGEVAFQYLDRLANLIPEVKTHELMLQLVFARETHFDGLQFLTEFGFVGLSLLVWVIFGISKEIKQEKNERIRTAFKWVMTVMFVSSLFTFSWQSAMAGPCAGFLLGCFLSRNSQPLFISSKYLRLTIPFALAFGSIIFYTCSAVWTARIPLLIQSNAIHQLDREIPGGFYRFRSLVGAGLGKTEDQDRALGVLEDAQKGYVDIWVWNNLANLHMQRKEWEEAIALYTRWAQTGIRYDEALRNLSVALEASGEYRQAGETLGICLNLWYPENVQSIQRLAVLFLNANETRKTLHVLNKYQGIWQEFPSQDQAMLWNIRGAAYLKSSALEDAKSSFERALELDPKLQSAQRNLQTVLRLLP